jgi:hypothetical protein
MRAGGVANSTLRFSASVTMRVSAAGASLVAGVSDAAGALTGVQATSRLATARNTMTNQNFRMFVSFVDLAGFVRGCWYDG